MPIFDEFVDARSIAPEKSGLIQLSRSIGHVVGTTGVEIVRPAGMRILTVRCESGTIRCRPGLYGGWRFTSGNMNLGTSEITVELEESPRLHDHVTGDGPFQITTQQALLVAGTPIVIDETANTFTRTGGTWWQDGFWAGRQFTVANSSDNDGTFTVAAGGVSNTILTVDEDITVGEASQTDLVITGLAGGMPTDPSVLTNYWAIRVDDDTIELATSLANALAETRVAFSGSLNSGRFNFAGPAGWATDAVAAASKTDGYGSIAVTAGNEISFAAPERMTLVGMAAADACSYWWGR